MTLYFYLRKIQVSNLTMVKIINLLDKRDEFFAKSEKEKRRNLVNTE